MVYELKFSALESWPFPRTRKYQYDFISDEQIQSLLSTKQVRNFELAESWSFLTENHSTKSDNPIHAIEVAKMVLLMKSEANFPPVTIRADEDIDSGYCVSDGQHRLRAMKFLSKETFQAEIKSGLENTIGYLVNDNAL